MSETRPDGLWNDLLAIRSLRFLNTRRQLKQKHFYLSEK